MGLCGHVQDEERAMARREGWTVRMAWEGTQPQGGPVRTRWGVRIFGRTTKRSFFFFLPHKTRVAKCHDGADRRRERDREQKRLLKDGQD